MVVVTKQVKDVDHKWWNVSSHFFHTREAFNEWLKAEAVDARLRLGHKSFRKDGKIRFLVKEVEVIAEYMVKLH